MDLRVEPVFVKMGESKYRKNSKLRIEQEISQMVRKVQKNQEQEAEKKEEKEKRGRKDKESAFARTHRRDRPADLVYG